MARKDERGVVRPAPLQFNNPASAAMPRYDDEHRGPAVTEAYELSRCRIDLAEHSQAWPSPANLPPRMVELAQAIPQDQRADWLRQQANLEEADRLISNAMRSGDLPIWVAPVGEPERLVAPGAMVEVDHATVVSGVYRPPNDRNGWLFGRPLFIKRDNWERFVAKVQADKSLTVAPPPDQPLLPPELQFVTLSEALSWIAFGVSMDNDKLHEVLSLDRYGDLDPQAAIKAAVAQLTDLGSGEKVTMRGKFRSGHHEKEKILLTGAIEPIKLQDYRLFGFLDDELMHGDGLLFSRDENDMVFDQVIRDGRKESYLKVTVNRTDLLREFPPTPFTLAARKHLAAAAQTNPVERLFVHWRSEARRNYEAARDAVSSKFSSAGRMQSGHHIRGLSEAAERGVIEMLSKARALPIPPESYATALANALALFDESAAHVRADSIGARGRMPTSANGAVADRFIDEGRERIEAEVAKWELEDQLRFSVLSPPAGNGRNQTAGPSPVVKRRGRKIGSGSMADADSPILAEMKALITDHKAHSANGAATLLAAKASGNGTIESKIARLAKRYRASDVNSSG